MQIHLAFVLSFISLAFGVGSGVFFFYLWKDSQYKNSFLLKSAIGIFLMYLFQVPFILANGGVQFVQARFNLFFASAFLAKFLGLMVIFTALMHTWSKDFISNKLLLISGVLSSLFLVAGLFNVFRSHNKLNQKIIL